MLAKHLFDALSRQDSRKRKTRLRQKCSRNSLKSAAAATGRIWYARIHEKTLLGLFALHAAKEGDEL